MKRERVGEIFKTKEGCEFIIIEYRKAVDIDIQFLNGYVMNVTYNNIKNGTIKNPFHPSVVGVGYLGVGKYNMSENRKLTKNYRAWYAMLLRAYGADLHKVRPTYIGCSVDKNWHCFQNFAAWFEENYIEGFELDKDILIKGNKIYSPETCVFIPHSLNTFFLKCDASRGKYKIGVHYNKTAKKFVARCNVNGKKKCLGYFNTEDEAFNVYKLFKESEARRIAEDYKYNLKLYNVLMNYQVETTD
jgi:hypothetical protein